MKVWSAVFNLLGICIIVIMVTVFYRHLDVIQTDYDTAVLRQAVEYAGRKWISRYRLYTPWSC